MAEKILKWWERSGPDDGHVEQVYLDKVTEKQLVEINVGDWIQGYGLLSTLAEQQFIRRYGKLLYKLKDDPEWDGTDAAHPAFLRGSLYSCHQAARLIQDVLFGRDTGKGKMNDPAGTMRDSVLELKRIADWSCQRVCDLEMENGLYFEQKTDLEEENKRLIEELRLAKERLNDG